MSRRHEIRTVARHVSSCVAVFFLGCAAFDSTPAWVNGGQPPGYSKHDYVSAVGVGETLAAAQIAAMTELSSVFSIRLTSEVEINGRETTVDDRTTDRFEMLVETKISTEIELEGAEIPLHWRDSRRGEVWALAVLDRQKECARIGKRGHDLATRLDWTLAGLPTSTDPLDAIRVRLAALAVGIELDGLRARSRAVGSECMTADTLSTGRLRAELDSLLRALSFVVTAQEIDPRTGEPLGNLPQLRETIAGNLTRMGFQVGPVEGARMVPIVADMRLQRARRGPDWVEYRWEGSARVMRPLPSKDVVIAAAGEGAESHPEDSMARLRARRKGERALSSRLDAMLNAFLLENERP